MITKALSLVLGSFLLAPQPSRTLRELHERLQTFPGAGEGTGIMSKEARPLLLALKHGIRDLLLDGLNSASNATSDVDVVKTGAVRELKRQGISYFEDRNGEYGDVTHLELVHAGGRADVVVAFVTLEVPETCGEDASIYVFRRTDGTWGLAASVEVADYEEGTRDRLKYVVSSPHASGELHVVVTYSHSWCSSCWAELDVEAVSLSSPDATPVLVRMPRRAFYSCEGYRLEAAAGGFALRWVGLSEGLFETRWARYAVAKGRIVRLESSARPYAGEARRP